MVFRIYSIFTLCFVVMSAAGEAVYYKLPYAIYGKEIEDVYADVVVKVNSKEINPIEYAEDSVANAMLKALRDRDVPRMVEFSTSNSEFCKMALEQLDYAYKGFLESNPQLRSKVYIGETVYYSVSDESSRQIRLRVYKDAALQRWMCDMNQATDKEQYANLFISTLLGRDVEDSIATEKDTVGLKEWICSGQNSDNPASVFAKIYTARTVQELDKIDGLQDYKDIFKEAVEGESKARFGNGPSGYITEQNLVFNESAFDDRDALSKLLGNSNRYLAVLDADPLFIFWLPEIRVDANGISHEGTWRYEIVKLGGKYMLQNQQSFIGDLTEEMVSKERGRSESAD